MIATSAPANKAALLVSAALLLRQAGEDRRAIEVLQDAVRAQPAYAPALTLLGALYQATGEAAQAESAYRKALAIDPDHAEALQGLGLFFVSQQRYSEALPYLQKQLKRNPADPLSLDGLISALTHLPGREKEIEAALRKAWQKSHDPEIGIRLGRYLLDQEQLSAAREVLGEVVAVSRTPRALAELALVCVMTDECDCAIEYLQEAVEIDPQFDRGWRGLSQCYGIQGKPDLALETAEHALAINPKQYRNWQVKGYALASLEQTDQALEAFQKGIDLILAEETGRAEALPVLKDLYSQRIFGLQISERLDEALAETETARQAFPGDVDFVIPALHILSDAGRPGDGLALLDSLEDTFSAERLAPFRYMLLHLLGEGEQAWEVVRPGLGQNTQRRVQALANLGANLYQRGMRLPAIAIYRQLAAFTPDDVRIATNLGYFLIGEGDYSGAEALLRRVISTENPGEYGEIARCNLAYIWCLAGNYVDALDAVTKVITSKHRSREAILRTPFWVGGIMVTDPVASAGRNISLQSAAAVCTIAVMLALGKIEKTEKPVEVIEETRPDDLILKMLSLGCIAAAKGELDEAREFWNGAMETIADPVEKSTIAAWQETLNGDSR